MSFDSAMEAIRAVEAVLGVSICCHDYTGRLAEGIPGIAVGHFSPCCLKIKDQERPGCLRFDAHLVREQAAQRPSAFWKLCHAGIFECVVPLRVSGALAGVLYAGPCVWPAGRGLPAGLCEDPGWDGTPSAFVPRDARCLDQEGFAAIPTVLDLLAERLVRALESMRVPATDRRSRITTFVERRFRSAVNLADLARHLFVTESRTSQLLRELFGKTFPQLLNEYRIRHAQRLLAHTHWPIEAVSNECGYSDRHYFHRAFRRYAGTTPAAFRDQCQSTPAHREEP